MLYKVPVIQCHTVFVDACLQGMGALYNLQGYYFDLRQYTPTYTNIVHLEMLNVLVCLRVWIKHYENAYVNMFYDNMAVVQVL